MPYFTPRFAAFVIDLAKIQEITRLLVSNQRLAALLFLPTALKKSDAVLATGEMSKRIKLDPITYIHCHTAMLFTKSISIRNCDFLLYRLN